MVMAENQPVRCARRRGALAVLLAAVVLWAGAGLAKTKPAQPKLDDAAIKKETEGKTPQERIEILRGWLDEGRASKELYFHLGNAHYEAGDATQAANSFEQAVAQDSTFFKAIVNLGLMYDELNNAGKAIETFEMAARLEPNNPDVWSHMGNTYYTQKDYTKATDLYRKALALEPKAVHALYSLGVAFADAGIFREAVHYWKRVVELDPQSEIGKNASENVELLQKYLIP
jgi:tetratricopeptide (TPR) repeat protein